MRIDPSTEALWALCGGVLTAAIAAIAIYGFGLPEWLIVAAAWGGSLLFAALIAWLESDTHARRRRARRRTPTADPSI